MSATLLSFTRRSPGWDNEELALLIRVQRLLAGAGLDVEMEVGQTEEGDPWCVFCTAGPGDVVIHVARIDGVYILDSSALARPIEGRSLMHCAERFLAEAPLVAPSANRGATLYLHPSAMLAGVFMTILVFAQMNAETAGFGTPGSATAEDGSVEAEGEAPATLLRQIAQQVAAFLSAETRNGERNTDQTAPTQNWVMLQSAAMIATLALSQDEKLLAALLSSALGTEALALASEENGEEVVAHADASTGAPRETGEVVALTGFEEAVPAPEASAANLFPHMEMAEAAAAAPTAVVDEFLDGDSLLIGSAGADSLLLAALEPAVAVAAPPPTPVTIAAAEATSQPELREGPIGVSESALADRVIDALLAAGAREVSTVPDAVQDVLDEMFRYDTLDLVIDGPVAVADPVAPVTDAPETGGVLGDIGGEAVRQRASEAQFNATDGAANGAPHEYAAHLRVDEDLFRMIADDVANHGQQKLQGGNVIYFDNNFSQIADAEDLILLSVEKADLSLMILVTYAASLDLEDWLTL